MNNRVGKFLNHCFHWRGLIGLVGLSFLAFGCRPAAPTMVPVAETMTFEGTVSQDAAPFQPTSTNPLPTPTLPPPTQTSVPPTSTPTLLPSESREFIIQVREQDGMREVYVPAGEFTMGSTDTPVTREEEKPAHQVVVNAFWIDQTEVTNAMFAQFVEETGYTTTAEEVGETWVNLGTRTDKLLGGNWRHPEGPASDLSGRENYPVGHVSWFDANAYCEWAGGRLPTEAEWEKAARGTDGRTYPWGEGIDCSRAQYASNAEVCGGAPTSVGLFTAGASPYGALDMAGNAWEWTSSLVMSYPYQADDGRENPETDYGDASGRAVRGGNYEPRTAFRRNLQEFFTIATIGFRCARSSSTLPSSQTPSPATAIPVSTSPPDGSLDIESRVREQDAMIEVYVPAGEFTMGSASTIREGEQPVHKVFLEAFWIDQTEVTNAMFAQFVEETGYRVNAGDWVFIDGRWDFQVPGVDWQHPKGPDSDLSGIEAHPVVLLRPHEAAAYCEWVGGRLPTEAEWEKAARGTDERTYPWGEGLDCSRAQYHGCGGQTKPVGSFPVGASPYGALDMAGNVWEWTSSNFKPYPYQADDGREEYDVNVPDVVRSGSWSDNYFLRASSRFYYPFQSFSNVGFRCVRSP